MLVPGDEPYIFKNFLFVSSFSALSQMMLNSLLICAPSLTPSSLIRATDLLWQFPVEPYRGVR